MVARVLLRRSAAPLTAAVLVGSIAFAPKIAYAEAAEDRHSSKKPIYDDFDGLDAALPPAAVKPKPLPAATTSQPPAAVVSKTEQAAATVTEAVAAITPTSVSETLFPNAQQQHVVRRPTPTDRLAAQIRLGRLFLYRQACTAEDAVNRGMSRAFDLEQSFTSTIASLAPPRESNEKLMPGLIYVLVGGMAGSIVARNRNILLRASMPLALGVGVAWTVIPVTMTNVSALLWKYESRFPAVADAHVRTREGIEKGIVMAKVHAEIAQRKVEEGVTEARETIEGWVRKGK
ncbi:apolipo protein O-domain-containing protein [Apodospora peruviana]|uniref:MICOS complex subunit n=1 Tax=Apodospora peruviana TaxID=516989 RepID=A0AAE0IQU3_9PEZI|nr:apolipo protein O-domain-containing protein [Apodospora peruviana]